MIHATALLDLQENKVLLHTTHGIDGLLPNEDIKRYIEYAKDSIRRHQIFGGRKYIGRLCKDNLAFLVICDPKDSDIIIRRVLKAVCNRLVTVLNQGGMQRVKESYESIVQPCLYSVITIAIIGEAGVGKTSFLRLLRGQIPSLEYVPTVSVDTVSIENISFAGYLLIILDFGGQEMFRKLWDLYMDRIDAIIVVTDSTLKNAVVSKGICESVRKKAAGVPLFAIANKQDLHNALDPSVLSRLLSADVFPLVAIDLSFREQALKIILDIISRHAKIRTPRLSNYELTQLITSDQSAQ